MCGIAGFIRQGRDREILIGEMNRFLRHRGPDASGSWLDDASGLTLGHVRLSIRDLSAAGAQPMHSHTGRTVIVYNGELYHTDALYEASGSSALRGTSDTEILLEAIEALGPEEALRHARGMFAFAAYDRANGTLCMAVDRAGEKPLYYGFVGESFVFGSEPSVFTVFPGFEKRIDSEALAAYFRYSYVPAPACIYAGMRKLSPGELLILKRPFTRQDLTLKRYWSLADIAAEAERAPFTGSKEEALEELERLLSSSVKGQLVSDVPLGAYLSGGIDSTLVVSLMSELSPDPVRTYTIGFSDPAYDESEDAAAIAARLGVKHSCHKVTEKDLLSVIPKLPEVFAEPFGDSSQIPTYLVAGMAAEKEKVVLSGDGGDELFGGYTTYPRIAALSRRLGTIPGFLRHAGAGLMRAASHMAGKRKDKLYRIGKCLLASSIEELHEAVCYHIYAEVDCLVDGGEGDQRPSGSSLKRELTPYLRDPLKAQLLLDACHYLPGDVLVKVDRCGMAHSLENRIPLLDKDILRFVWSLPAGYQFGEEGGKTLLKKLLYKRVPKEMLERPKKGFSVPLKKWLSGELSEWKSELLAHSRLVEAGLVNGAALKALSERFERFAQGERALWNVLMAEEWMRKWA